MNQKVAEIRAEHWRQTVYGCINRDPKISKRQWCEENGIKVRSLMYWQRKFQMEAIERMESHETALPMKTSSANAPAFVDMTAQLEALQPEQGSIPTDPEIVALAPELMIRAGSFRIYVNSSIRETTLATVMMVIRHA